MNQWGWCWLMSGIYVTAGAVIGVWILSVRRELGRDRSER